jgi:tryptophan-rich sensory protein
MNKNIKNYLALAFFILLPLFVGYLSSVIPGVSFKETYSLLNKPSFSPSPSVFGPVWTVLYILMGIAAYLVWRERKKKDITCGMVLFFVQLFFNFLWSIIFFGMNNYLLAFIEIIILLALITGTVLSFDRISKASAYLLIPYLYWVCFATFLTFNVFKLN